MPQNNSGPENVEFDANGYPKIIVQNGETPESLGKKFGCSAQDIINANQQAWNGKWFKVGTKIVIPKVISPDDKNLQGRKSKRDAEAEWSASKSKNSPNPASARTDLTQPKDDAISSDLDKDLRENLGLINYNGKGEKITSKSGKSYTVIGQAKNARKIVKDAQGNIKVMSHDGQILKQEYVLKSNESDKVKKTSGESKIAKTGEEVAKSLIDDIFGLGTGKDISSHIKEINSSNVMDVLDNYKAMSDKKAFGKGETLFDGILGENISDSDKKRYINHIKDALAQRARDLGGEATSIGETLKNEINYALVEKWPMQNAKYLNESLDKFNKCISQLEAMNQKSSDVAAEKIAKGEKVTVDDNSDLYGNGKLDGNAMQITGNCWAHAGLNAMRATEKGREILANCIVKKDGVTTVYLAGAKKLGLPKPNGDGLYSYSEQELKAGMKNLSVGDGDYTAVMMALEDYKRQSLSRGGNAVSLQSEEQALTGKGGTVGEVIKIITGNDWDREYSGLPTYTDLKDAFNSGNYSIDFAVGHGRGKMSYTGTIQNGKFSNTPGVIVGSEEAKGGHAVAITRMTDDYVYAVESNSPDTTMVIRKDQFMNHVTDINLWNLNTNTGAVYVT